MNPTSSSTAVEASKPIHIATTERTATGDPRRAPLVAAVLVLLVGAAVTFAPFVAPIVLAAWAAHLARPLAARFSRALGGRGRAAGILTGTLLLFAVLPLVLAVLALVPAARSLFEQIRGASGGTGALAALVSNSGGGEGTSLVDLAKEYAAGASRVALVVGSISLQAIVGSLVFFALFFAFLVDGEAWWVWVRRHAFGEASVMSRLSEAFHATGRGLIVGSGLTALAQGGIATVLYAAFGVPRALLLGMLSVLAALVPMTGPMIVWIPVCAGLALTGHVGKAIGLAVLCAGVVGTIDNVLRPWLSRRFAVGMPAMLVLVAMLGGVVVFGGWGLFLGPLLVRLAGEMLRVCRERGVFGADDEQVDSVRYSKTP